MESSIVGHSSLIACFLEGIQNNIEYKGAFDLSFEYLLGEMSWIFIFTHGMFCGEKQKNNVLKRCL
jgi:hypothetical protein